MPWFQPASALASPRAARRMWPALGQTMDSPAEQFAAWLPYSAYLADEMLFVNRDSMGFMLEVMPQSGADERMAEVLISLYSTCPPGTGIQFHLFASPHVREQLRAEAAEGAPAILLTVSDSGGRVIRRLTAPASKGYHRVAWDLRMAPTTLADNQGAGPFVIPGQYQVAMAKRVNGQITAIGQPRKFDVEGPATLKQLHEFLSGVQRLQLSVTAANRQVTDARARIASILRAVDNSGADLKHREEAVRIDRNLKGAQEALTGDRVLADRYENLPPAIQTRVNNIRDNYRMFTGAPHKTDQDSYKIASDEFATQMGAILDLHAFLFEIAQSPEGDFSYAAMENVRGRTLATQWVSEYRDLQKRAVDVIACDPVFFRHCSDLGSRLMWRLDRNIAPSEMKFFWRFSSSKMICASVTEVRSSLLLLSRTWTSSP